MRRQRPGEPSTGFRPQKRHDFDRAQQRALGALEDALQSPSIMNLDARLLGIPEPEAP